MRRPLREDAIRRGLIRPCVPTPLVRDSKGVWRVVVPVLEL